MSPVPDTHTRLLHAHSIDVFVSTNLDDTSKTFTDWCQLRKTKCPQFLFWYTNLELELLVLTFLRSVRMGNFDLYVATLTKLTPWFPSLNHTNYARWMPVHFRDMCSVCEFILTLLENFDAASSSWPNRNESFL